jgi:hypothetical protein
MYFLVYFLTIQSSPRISLQIQGKPLMTDTPRTKCTLVFVTKGLTKQLP